MLFINFSWRIALIHKYVQIISVQLHTLLQGEYTHLTTTKKPPSLCVPGITTPNINHYADFHHPIFALPLFELYTNVSLNMYFQCVAEYYSIFYLWNPSMWSWVVYLDGCTAFRCISVPPFIYSIVARQTGCSLEIFQVMLLWARYFGGRGGFMYVCISAVYTFRSRTFGSLGRNIPSH